MNIINKIKNRGRVFSSMSEFDDNQENIKTIRKNFIFIYVLLFLSLSATLIQSNSVELLLLIPIMSFCAVALLSIAMAFVLWPLHLGYKYSYVLKYTSTVALIISLAGLPYSITRNNPDYELLYITYTVFAVLISLFIFRVSYYTINKKNEAENGDSASANDDEYGFIEDMEIEDNKVVVNKKSLALSMLGNISKVLIIMVLGYLSMVVAVSI